MGNTKRVLLKISGELLNSWSDVSYVHEMIIEVAQKIVALQKKWYEIVIVIGAWNLWRAKDMQWLGIERVKSDYIGMTAIIMNATVLNEVIQQQGGSSIVYAPAETQIPNCTQVYTVRDAKHSLASWDMVLCSWGVSLPYSTTDFVAIQRALELECDMVIKITKVDGLYDKDPHVHADAKRFDEISYDEALHLQVAVMDQHALALARMNDVVLYICHMDELAMLGTKDIKGTRVHV